MGGHDGSVQVRSEDHAAVKAAAEMVAQAKNIHCLVGPTLNGWVGVYPENNGQDESVGREIAKQLGADVLHLMVHDDSVLAYWLWRNQQLVDSYWSAPGYFGEENREEEERHKGDPRQFLPIIGDRAHKLAALLDREKSPAFEYERLEKLAKLLRISNVVTAYEYLKEGESDGIEARRSFCEVPANRINAEKQQKKAQGNRVQNEIREYKKKGLLLVRGVRGNARVYRLDLFDGIVRELAELPGVELILRLVLSYDGNALGIGGWAAGPGDGSGERRCVWNTWSYSKLRGSSA